MSGKPSSATLSGFAPAAGPGASGTAEPSSAAMAAASEPAAAAPPAAPAATKSAPANAAAAASQPKPRKKRAPKKGGGAASSAAAAEHDSRSSAKLEEETDLQPLSEVGPSFAPLSLPQIQLRLKNLLVALPTDLPATPPDYDVSKSPEEHAAMYAPVKSFAGALQEAVEEYNLLLSLVSAATYKWGVDRSGASQQNLSVMSAELQACQDVISNVVSARLSNVLCPAVDVLIGEVEIVRDGGGSGGEDKTDPPANGAAPAKKRKLNDDRLATGHATTNERRINHYARPLVDPSYVHLCHVILARNAPMIRHTVATSVHSAQRVIGDYLTAMKKDSSHEAGKGGYY